MAMNMEAVLRIAAKVDGGTALEKLGRQLVGIGESAGKTLSPFGAMKGALRGVADAAATIGLAAVGRDLLQAGIDAQAADTRIRALAGGFKEVEPLTGIAAKAAKEFALGNVEAKNAITDLYGRLRPMGVPLKDIETVFFGINKAAKQVGLSSYDTSEVLLQLSQALGSGKLQGDELRSIMERMPAVGQAVAKVMGVSASEIKKLGSEGKITTDVMIRAAAELNKIQPPPPTPMQEFEKAIKDLRTEIGENLLPILTPFVKVLTELVKGFAALPEPVQTAVVLIGALAIAAGPIASVITGIGQALILLSPILTQAGVLFAGFQTVVIVALQGILSWVAGTLIPGLLAFFTGPVGWTVLAVAAVVAMAIAFREPIMKFFQWLWEWGEPIRNFWVDLWKDITDLTTEVFSRLTEIAYETWVKPWIDLWNNVLREPVGDLWKWILGQAKTAYENLQKIWRPIATWWQSNIVKPLQDAWKKLSEFIPKALQTAAKAVKGAFDAVMNAVKGAFRGVLQFIASQINTVAGLINRLIATFNKLPGNLKIPMIPTLSVPAFAQGGVVDRATVAMVGEAGREYIIPESKMAAASARYLAGARGADVVPTTAAPSAGPSNRTPVINITTGPVMEFNGERYVKLEDLDRAARQITDGVFSRMRTPAARIAMGIA